MNCIKYMRPILEETSNNHRTSIEENLAEDFASLSIDDSVSLFQNKLGILRMMN